MCMNWGERETTVWDNKMMSKNFYFHFILYFSRYIFMILTVILVSGQDTHPWL